MSEVELISYSTWVNVFSKGKPFYFILSSTVKRISPPSASYGPIVTICESRKTPHPGLHYSNLKYCSLKYHLLGGWWTDKGCRGKVRWLWSRAQSIILTLVTYRTPEEEQCVIDSRRYGLEKHRKWLMDMPLCHLLLRLSTFHSI